MAKRVDSNQKEIVACMRNMGATVAITSMVGKGFPDLVVGFRGKNYLVEVKDGSKSASRKSLTTCEFMFHDTWKGQVAVVESVDDAIVLLQNTYVNAKHFCVK
jgi:hypothetical protein